MGKKPAKGRSVVFQPETYRFRRAVEVERRIFEIRGAERIGRIPGKTDAFLRNAQPVPVEFVIVVFIQKELRRICAFRHMAHMGNRFALVCWNNGLVGAIIFQKERAGTQRHVQMAAIGAYVGHNNRYRSGSFRRSGGFGMLREKGQDKNCDRSPV